MSLARSAYNLLFRKTSHFAVTVMVGAVIFERVFDQGGDTLFEKMNNGKLWKHVRRNYENQGEE